MNKSIILVLVFAFFSSILPAEAQRSYRGVDLSRNESVPLYDCSIFWSGSDRRDCQELARASRYSWDNGYAVQCRKFKRNKRDICLDLAASITYNESAFDCSVHNRNRQAKRDCLVTKRAYGRGEYNMTRDYDFDSRFDREFDTVTTSVTPITTTTAVTTCGPAFYDSSYDEWREATKRLRRRSNERRVVGGLLTVFGAVINATSDSGTGRAIGTAMMVGGVTFTTLGLIDLSEARMTMPHLRRECSTSYIQETKYVVVNERRCTSTRYTEHGFGSSRSYYEVNCQNERYVTYKRFDAWESSTEYAY